jgi:hypothetical protein
MAGTDTREKNRYNGVMRHALVRHPDTPCAAVSAIEVYVARGKGGNLLLHYYITGSANAVTPAFPSPATRRRADELWLHTCLEAFIMPDGGEAYWELNLAPTWDWQAYALSGYRAGRHPEGGIEAPSTEGRYGHGTWEMRTHWMLAGTVPNDVPWRLGLAAVIEETGGAISYWALRHAPDKPDFHHPDAFALDIAVTS